MMNDTYCYVMVNSVVLVIFDYSFDSYCLDSDYIHDMVLLNFDLFMSLDEMVF